MEWCGGEARRSGARRVFESEGLISLGGRRSSAGTEDRESGVFIQRARVEDEGY